MQGKFVAPINADCYYCSDGANRVQTLWSKVICIFVWIASATFCFGATPSTAKNVLFLNSWTDRDVLGNLEPLKLATRSHISTPVSFEVEYLESQRFGDEGYEKGLSESLASEYRGKVDLVIADAYPALFFAVKYRSQIFPGVPIVFEGVDRSRLEGLQLWPGVTGVTTSVDVRGTIELALRLQPDTTNVAVIGGTSEFEQYWLKILDRQLRPYEPRLKLTDLVGLPPEELLKEVAALPPHTIVFFQLIPLESAQPVMGTYDILAAISQRIPTYCIFSYCLDHGAIGGSYPTANVQQVKGGELAARVLSGEKPETIPVVDGNSSPHATVDWRQIQRWNMPRPALRPDIVVLHRPPTVWEQYKKYAFAAIAVCLIQTMLIVGLLVQRSVRRKTEARLRESEERFRLMADTTPSLVWMSDKDGKVIYLNNRRIEFTGRDPKAGLEDTWKTFIHPDDLEQVETANAQAREKQEPFSKEYRLRRKDGVYRWMFDVAAPRIHSDGSFAGFIGSAIDISDQKEANEALESIGGKLIEAQEKERRRIARELHDDICQRLALLALELGSSGSKPARMEDARKHCVDIAADVQALSHKLHSTNLDYLGVETAISSFCREFSQQHHVNVEFTSENIPNPLPRDISLSLFRVTQEALHNAVKYSGVDKFTVDLRGTGDSIQLEVGDAGAGFHLQTAKLNGGLGLVSMQERVHLVKGVFTVETNVNLGTKIVARVPVPAGPLEGNPSVSSSVPM
jgi:PAS domain S-box-containing protein